MRSFAAKEQRPAPAARKASPYVHHPMGPVQHAQQAEIRRILRSTGAQAKLTIGQPNDKYEQEADRVADQVMAMPDQKLQRQPENEDEEETVQTKPLANQITPLSQRQEEPLDEEEEELQTKALNGMVQRQAEVEDLEEETLQANAAPGHTPTVGATAHAKIQSLKGGGQPLPANQRTFYESRMGHDFSGIRIHTDTQAADTAEAVQAKAFTLGNNIVFGGDQYSPNNQKGKKLLAHELTHVVQQENAVKRVQRYESGEHAQFGETQAELKMAFAPSSYRVRKGESLRDIARKFGITVVELKDANKAKLKKWPTKDGSGRMIKGFYTDEMVSIPQKLNDFARDVLKDKSAKITINGVVVDYSVGIAMGDFFESPDKMNKEHPDKLKELKILIKREQAGGKVTTQEWQTATNGRYVKLAEKNEAHFAPPSPGLVKPTAAGAASSNHKLEWEKYHKAALESSKSGDKNKALTTNAFGDHFLTDAFAAGHLINKRDVMEKFKANMVNKKGQLTKEAVGFFDSVAKRSFVGAVRTEFSQYETVEKHWGAHPDIDRVSRFSTLLQGIHELEPDLVSNAIAKAVHDVLNTLAKGLPVTNRKWDSWNLSGDGTLNAKSREIGRKAVAQSQLNLLGVFMSKASLKLAALFKKVWDYVPRPSKATGQTLVREKVKSGTDPKEASLVKAVADLITKNYKLILHELVVERKKLRKA